MSDGPAIANGKPRGRPFQKGNPGGPGNPNAAKVMRNLRIVLNTVTDDDLVACTKTLVMLAKAGDLGALKILFDRVCGKLMEVHEDGSTGPMEFAQFVRRVVEAGRDAAQGDPDAKIEPPKPEDDDEVDA